MNKFENLRPEYKIWFSSLQGDGILGDGKWKILKKIDDFSANDQLRIYFTKKLLFKLSDAANCCSTAAILVIFTNPFMPA